ncbi:MAG TPA: hypothetical protein VGE10_05660 [Zeimonas sp.]
MAKARFFYALRPDAAAADELAAIAVQAATRWGGRALAAADIHLTLAFVGMHPLEAQPALAAVLQGLPARIETVLALSELGSFGHGVLWIGPPADPHATAPAAGAFAHRLAQTIRERLRAAQIEFDDRPLKLHATLVRGAHALDRRTREDDTGAVAPAPHRVVARAWSVALGASASDSTPQRRYRWWTPPTSRTDPT